MQSALVPIPTLGRLPPTPVITPFGRKPGIAPGNAAAGSVAPAAGIAGGRGGLGGEV